MKLVIQILLGVLTLSFPCFADGERDGGSTGGGNVVQTFSGAVRFLDLMKVPTREILEPQMTDGYDELVRVMDSVDAFKKTTYIPKEYDQPSVTPYDKVLSALDSLTFYLVPGPIPELNDKGLVIFEKMFEGRILRLAAQSESSKTVLVDRDLFEKMRISPTDVAAFFAHEALIRTFFDNRNTSIHPNPRKLVSTERISNFINVLGRFHRI